MSFWKIKELAQLTGISSRALHHYDQVGLLRPAGRLESGYRLYNSENLLRLQHILALKDFGFSLQQIRKLLNKADDLLGNLQEQRSLLQAQEDKTKIALKTLDAIIESYQKTKHVDMQTIITLTGVYKMNETFKKNWMGQLLTSKEIEQFSQLNDKFTKEENIAYGQAWQDLIALVRKNMNQDPTGQVGKDMATQWMDLVNIRYGQCPEIRKKLWQGFKQNQIPKEQTVPTGEKIYMAGIDAEMCDWIDKAVKAHNLS